MDQQQLLRMFPDMDYDEMATVMKITQGMTDTQQQNFIYVFQGRRKDYQQMVLFTILGFFGVAGIQRFLTGDIGLGIIYFITAGLCFVGTIVDLINIKNITSKYNQKQAYEAAAFATANFYQ